MGLRNISAWSIRNPIVPLLAFVALLAAGLMSFMNMDVQDQPDIEFPVVIVSISQPGAAPTEVENQITQRVEAAIRNLDGIQSIRSTASEGSSLTIIEFALGTDIAEAVNEVKSQIDQIRGELPDGILEPRIFKQETSSNPIVYFGVTADDMTIEQLSWFIDDTITKRLLTVPGLAEVSRSGGVSREILVILDPARMQALGVTAAQVNNALRQANVNAAGGRAEIAGSRQAVRVLGNAEDAYALSQTQIALGGGRSVKLADIARVQDAYGELTSLARINGKPVVTFSITRARGESDVRVYDEAVKVLAELEEENPGLKFTRLFTEVDYTRGQYTSSMSLLVEGALLAIVVVFLFLRDWRATIIAAVAIPLSAIPTFFFMDLLGFTLNTMSLLALGLVAGVLVDDAIVEIENIVRHMRMGKSAYQAAIDAADEIGLAVVATTLCIVAVFFPVGMMPGIAGQFFKNFGLTVVASVLMSLAVARMITPMLAAYFLKSSGHAPHAEGRWMQRYLKVLRWSIDHSRSARLLASLPAEGTRLSYHLPAIVLAAYGAATALVPGLWPFGGNATQGAATVGSAQHGGLFPIIIRALAGYAAGAVITFLAGVLLGAARGFDASAFTRRARYIAVHWRLLDHRVWMMGLGLLALILTAILFATRPQQFFPNNDSDFSMIQIEMVPGTTLQDTAAVVAAIAERMRQEPEVDLALEIAREGSGMVRLVFKEDRARSSLEFEQDLTPVLQNIPDARANFQNQQSGGEGTGRAITIMLAGSNINDLNAAAAELVEQMASVPGAVAPRIDYDLQRPELIITPRNDLAASLGVTTAALSQAIRIATLGEIDQNAARFSLTDRQIPIRVRLAEQERRNLAAIRNLPVPTATGGSVPLSRVADISIGAGPTAIERYNQSRRVFVGVDLAPGYARGDVYNAIQRLPIMQNLPPGVSSDPVGADQWQQELIQNFIIAVVTGLFLVFAVLVLLYRRLVSPLVNMGSLFLAPLGGLLALTLVGQPISLPVYIGMLMLLGIVAKNSILLIDFSLEEMALGKSRHEAILEAGHKRAQPIVMTTVAMTAGMVPTALSLTGDAAWRAPMGTVVIGGLILSTALTLLIVPAGFSLADGLEKRIGPWLRDKFLTYRPGDGAVAAAAPRAAE